MLRSWNSWVSDTPLNFLSIFIATWSYDSISECLYEIFLACRFAIFPINSTSRRLCYSFHGLINIILTWSESTSIISKSCNLSNKNTFDRAIWLLNDIIIVIKIVGTTILIFFIEIEFQYRCQKSRWN